MTSSDKSIYYRILQQVSPKEGESAMSYIKIFQNAKDLSISLRNSYSEYRLIHIILNKFTKMENILHK